MSKPKIRINPECKRALLNQSIQLYSSIFHETDDNLMAFKFFKLLIVSKAFLDCSHHFEIYRLRLDLPDRLHKGILFSVPLEKDYSCDYFEYSLTLAQSKTFVRLFRSAFFGIQQCNHFIHGYINEIYELLRFTDGKIAFFFHKKHSEICHLRLVEAFSSRVHVLKCSGELLEDVSLPKLRLDNCEVFNLESIGQLAKVLRHHIRELKVTVNRIQYFEKEEIALIQKSDNELQVDSSVKSVKLHCDDLDFDEVKQLANVILKLCPNLKSFYIYSAGSDEFPEFFDSEFVDRHASSQRQKIVELKEILSTSCIKPHIKLELIIFGAANGGDFEDIDVGYWYEVNEDEFVGWEADRDYDFDASDDDMFEEDRFGHNFCSTYLTFEDEECKLELEVAVSVYGMRLNI